MALEEFGIISQVALAIAATTASLVGVELARRVANHDFHQSSLGILQDLTTGEVAAARDVVGTFMYGEQEQRAPLTRADVVRAYYTLLWCIERVARGYAAMHIAHGDSLRNAFCQSVDWHATEIVTNLSLLHRVLKVDDAQAWQSLTTATQLLSGPHKNRLRNRWKAQPLQISVKVVNDTDAARLCSARGLPNRALGLR